MISDFVDGFMEMTADELSPVLFRKWSAISCLAGALERRVWIEAGPRVTYPNLFVLLVAPPGVGKYIIEMVRDLWVDTKEPNSQIPAFKVAPDSMTNASMLDCIAAAKRTMLKPQGGMYTYHSLLIPAEEFGILLPKYDNEFIGTLNGIFNNKAKHEERRRTSVVKHLEIEYPQINLLGGAQPGWIATSFPEEAWSMGLTRRIIMVFCAEGVKKDLFSVPKDYRALRKSLLEVLSRVSALYGAMKWTEEAVNAIREWDALDGPPTPTHSKLVNYCRSRTHLTLKLSIVASISRSHEMILREEDIRRAIAWITEAESFMPDIFRAMLGRSDIQVVEELHFMMMGQFIRNGRKPMPGRMLYAFLQQRVPSERVEKIIEIAEKSNFISRLAGQDAWIPRPKQEQGVE